MHSLNAALACVWWKVTILARACGIPVKLEDVPVSSLVPAALESWAPAAGDVLADAFIQEMEAYDGEKAELIAKADAAGEVRLGYTFDAGPNAVLLLRREHAADALAAVLKYFPPSAAAADGYVSDAALAAAAAAAPPNPALAAAFPLPPQPGAVKKVYCTDVGPGAHVLPPTEALADAGGMPLPTDAAAAADGEPAAASLLSMPIKAALVVMGLAALRSVLRNK